MLVVLLFVGSATAKVELCPPIPSPPYIPKSPAEDIVKIEAYMAQAQPNPAAALPPSSLAVVNGPVVYVTVTFAAPTPTADQAIYIIITELQGNPATETVVGCITASDPSSLTYPLVGHVSNVEASVAVYAWLGPIPYTDRAPNTGSYLITSLSAAAPNLFYDPEPAPVGGVVLPTNTLAILTPYLALAGLAAIVSAVVVVKRRRD
jgi:hypothetical protein